MCIRFYVCLSHALNMLQTTKNNGCTTASSQLLNLPCYSILALYHGDSGTRTLVRSNLPDPAKQLVGGLDVKKPREEWPRYDDDGIGRVDYLHETTKHQELLYHASPSPLLQ
jgi:hypothetical protein